MADFNTGFSVSQNGATGYGSIQYGSNGLTNLLKSVVKEATGKFLPKIVREIQKEVATRIVNRTPVLSGQMVECWKPSLDGSFNTYYRIDKHQYKNRPVSDSVKNGKIAEISTFVDSFTQLKGAGSRYPSLILTNSVPYGLKMEYGSSDNRPYGMIRVTLNEIDVIIADVLANNTWGRHGRK